ncbi:hypothetical protein GGG16DRAFT_119509 [Schizophyllum commune]
MDRSGKLWGTEIRICDSHPRHTELSFSVHHQSTPNALSVVGISQTITSTTVTLDPHPFLLNFYGGVKLKPCASSPAQQARDKGASRPATAADISRDCRSYPSVPQVKSPVTVLHTSHHFDERALKRAGLASRSVAHLNADDECGTRLTISDFSPYIHIDACARHDAPPNVSDEPVHLLLRPHPSPRLFDSTRRCRGIPHESCGRTGYRCRFFCDPEPSEVTRTLRRDDLFGECEPPEARGGTLGEECDAP